jgi:hypothetical protein
LGGVSLLGEAIGLLRPREAVARATAKAKADSSAGLRNDNQKNGQRQKQRQKLKQIPPLGCGMTTKRTGNGKSKGKSRFLRCAAE